MAIINECIQNNSYPTQLFFEKFEEDPDELNKHRCVAWFKEWWKKSKDNGVT